MQAEWSNATALLPLALLFKSFMDGSESTFASILSQIETYLPSQDLTLLKKAYQFSLEAHQTQKRATGDPYIVHPLAVVQTLAELQLDLPTLAAGFLHDVLEDTPISKEIVLREFGEEITNLVEGVTKISSLEQIHKTQEELALGAEELSRQAEYWRKMLIATAQDIRVILLKLCDRYHNMETLQHLSPEKRKRIAEETLTLYAPLAQRLGMYKLKSKLEDLSFKYLEPENYETLNLKLKEQRVQEEEFLKNYVEKIETVLKGNSIPYKISARPKNIYSIYRKMLKQNKPFEEIQDLIGVRLITDTIENCYALLGIVHTHFFPLPNTFTDYIAFPKTNFYQSLHTTIKLSEKEIVEVQIRTEEMHEVCEYGIASHWKYKQSGPTHPQTTRPLKENQKSIAKESIEDRLDWIKQILEWQQDAKSPKEFIEWLKLELEFDEVYVFTPKWEVKKLPLGSTVLDFAYAIHTDLGHHCIGGKINDRLVRIDMVLKSGERCEVLTKKNQTPHKDWLEFVKTPRAKSKIRKYLRETGET